MLRTSTNRAMIMAIAAVFSTAAIVNCSSDKKTTAARSDIGSIGLAIKLSNAVNVAEVDYEITGNGITPITGKVDVSDPAATLSFTVNGIPAGAGYLIKLSAKSSDGKTSCAGQANFAVEAGRNTAVSITLQCGADVVSGGVSVDAAFNNCPLVTSYVVAPQVVSIGGKISLSATASDLDTDALTFAWTSPVGTFDSGTTAAAKYTCTQGGPQTLTLTVSDGKCESGAAVSVTCKALSCGNGQVETALGEECDPPNGVTCNADCLTIDVCGDGTVGKTEQCEPPGNAENTCDAQCRSIAVACGNSVVQTGEQCDPPGSAVAGGVCTATCTLPKAIVCGDGVKDPGEDCDAGAAGSSSCTADCKAIDLCIACEKASCDAASAGCDLYTGARKTACLAWKNCILETNCAVNGTDPQKCYCGTASDGLCLGGLGNGVCKAQAEAAAETTAGASAETQAVEVAERFRDPEYPIGGGSNAIFCYGVSCVAQCLTK